MLDGVKQKVDGAEGFDVKGGKGEGKGKKVSISTNALTMPRERGLNQCGIAFRVTYRSLWLVVSTR